MNSEPQSVARLTIHIAISVLILATGIAGFYLLGKLRAEPTQPPPRPGVLLVDTVTAEPHAGGLQIEAYGLVVPHREITISAEVSGRIQFKDEQCKAGHYVAAGTLLIQIDTRDYELEIRRLARQRDQSEASLAELEVEIQNTEALIDLAENDVQLQRNELRRLEALGVTRVVSDSQVDAARRAELAARNSLVKEQSQLLLLKTRRPRLEQAIDQVAVAMEGAQLDMDRTRLSAPVDGVIVSDSVEQGNFVQRGSPLFTLEDTSAAEVKCQLRMDQMRWLWQEVNAERELQRTDASLAYEVPPTPVHVEYQLAGRDYTWNGVLSRYDGIGIDQKTRTVPCRILVEHPQQVSVSRDPTRMDGDLVPRRQGPPALIRGLYVTIRIEVAPDVDLVTLPERAVRPGNVIWRVIDDAIQIRTVQIAQVTRGVVLIHADSRGLVAGDHVVVSPLATVKEGMPVRTTNHPKRPTTGKLTP